MLNTDELLQQIILHQPRDSVTWFDTLHSAVLLSGKHYTRIYDLNFKNAEEDAHLPNALRHSLNQQINNGALASSRTSFLVNEPENLFVFSHAHSEQIGWFCAVAIKKFPNGYVRLAVLSPDPEAVTAIFDRIHADFRTLLKPEA